MMTREEFKRRLRDTNGWSLRKFAEFVDMNEDTVYHWKDVPVVVQRLLEAMEKNHPSRLNGTAP